MAEPIGNEFSSSAARAWTSLLCNDEGTRAGNTFFKTDRHAAVQHARRDREDGARRLPAFGIGRSLAFSVVSKRSASHTRALAGAAQGRQEHGEYEAP